MASKGLEDETSLDFSFSNYHIRREKSLLCKLHTNVRALYMRMSLQLFLEWAMQRKKWI